MKINGKDYDDIKEVDFTNVLCDLEDRGINVMSMANTGNIKFFSLARAIISIYTGEKDLNKCGKILSQHAQNGGSIEEIVKPFTEAMYASGFGNKAAEEEKPTEETAEANKTK
jgi:hypothetical protein